MIDKSQIEKIYGHIGDNDPIEHGGGIVFKNEDDQNPTLIYFVCHPADNGYFVDVHTIDIAENVFEDVDWCKSDIVELSVYVDIPILQLTEYAKSDNVLTRADVYAAIAGYWGWHNLNSEPLVLSLEKCEDEYGNFVDECVRIG